MSHPEWVIDVRHLRFQALALLVIVVAGHILIAVTLRGIPIISMLRGGLNIQESIAEAGGLPVGVRMLVTVATLLLALYFASFVVFKKCYGYSKSYLAGILAVLIMAAVWFGNRQLMLIIIFYVVARYYLAFHDYAKKYSDSLMGRIRRAAVLLMVVVVFVAGFISIQYVRLQGKGASSFELILYYVFPVMNLDTALMQRVHLERSEYSFFILRELLPSRFQDDAKIEALKAIMSEPTASSSYLLYWYLDFGYSGAFIGSLLAGWFSRMIYSKRKQDESYMRQYLLILYCSAVASFYSHFIAALFLLYPFVALTVLRAMSQGGNVYSEATLVIRSLKNRRRVLSDTL